MSAPLLWSVIAIVAIPLAGVPWACFFGLRGSMLPAGSWLLGCGWLVSLMLLLSATQGRFSRLSLAILWLVVVGVGVVAWRAGRGAETPRNAGSAGRAGPVLALLTAIICGVQVAYVWLAAVRVPLGSFDSWSLWEYKGRRFWLDGMVGSGTLHDHSLIFAHPGYPPLLSLLISWVYTWVGAADPSLMKPIFPLFYGALLAAFHEGVRARLGSNLALLAMAALALLPRIADYAGTGLADVPMAAFVVGAAAAYCVYRETGDVKSLAAAGLLLGMAALTKRDALPYLGAGLAAVTFLEGSWTRRAWCIAPALGICAPWYLYVRVTGVPDRDFLPVTAANLGAHLDRLGPIARLFTLNLFATDEWSFLWYVLLATLLLAIPRKAVRAPVLLLLVFVPLVGFVGSLSLSAWPDYMLHVRTSLDRLILGTTPFALWFVCEQLAPARKPRREAP
jgi:hypothetical protein